MPISISHYLNNMARLTDQWTEFTYKDKNRQRIYLKDIDCPEDWHDKLKEHIPPGVFYLNESTGEVGGPGSVDEQNSSRPGAWKGRGVARAGDLMSCLPPAMRADNLMCYIGHEGTYTPAHREMCASLGQNIMVEASGTVDEQGKPCKPGSSIWFMTETKERHLVSEYWLSTLGHDIEVESHFAQINAWKAAPFKTYVVEQKVGDFLLIPPLAPHQVWNRGTRTMKVAWNRTTVETLEMALNEALPRARMVCRDEQYKNKAMVMFALKKYSDLLNSVDLQRQTTVDPQHELDLTYSPKIRQLQKDFRRLFSLFSEILLSEMLPPVAMTEKRGQYLPYDSYVTCSYCRCNIFNRFLTCTFCIVPLENGDEDTYDICMECYAMGRSCKCISRYKWVEQFQWEDLLQKHECWRLQIIGFDGKRVTEKSPQNLQVQSKNMTKKPLAQVCYEQLKARPWCNPKKEPENPREKELLLEEALIDENGTVRKSRKRKRQSEKFMRESAKCHISQHWEARWKVAQCGCGRGYHYGTLFRAFDVMPLAVMEDPGWKCPYCLKICSCPRCRHLPDWNPFEPNGTILGHDTRNIADPRSVESLVDFSHSNISWIKKAGDNDLYETRRLRRRKDEAALDQSNVALDDHYVDEAECTPVTSQYPDNGIKYNMDVDLPIDPMLTMEQVPTLSGGVLNGEVYESNPRPELVFQSAVHQNGHLSDSHTWLNKSHPNGLAAPAAMMVHHELGTNTAQDNHSIFYHYPDPTLPQFTQSPQKNGHPPPTTPQHDGQKDSVKRKRREARNIIQSDLAPSPKNDADEQFHHAQKNSHPPSTTAQHDGPEDSVRRKRQEAGDTIQSDLAPPLQKDFNEQFHHAQKNSPLPVTTAQHDGQQDSVRRKRQEAGDIPQSDVVLSPKNDANEQFHHAQTQCTPAEATHCDRLMCSEAPITGKPLLILPVDEFKSAEFIAQDLHAPPPQLSSEGDSFDYENVGIVQSEASSSPLTDPPPSVSHTDSPESNESIKKRKVRVVNDEAFSIQKSPGRKARTTRTDIASDVRKPLFYSEFTSDSDVSSESESLFVPQGNIVVEKLRKPHTVPARQSLKNHEASQADRDFSTRSPREDSHHAYRANVSESKQRKVKYFTAPVAEGAPPSNPLVPIDNFPAETLPEPDATVDLSMLGPGEITVRTNGADSSPSAKFNSTPRSSGRFRKKSRKASY